jgi:hypothetical protein
VYHANREQEVAQPMPTGADVAPAPILQSLSSIMLIRTSVVTQFIRDHLLALDHQSNKLAKQISRHVQHFMLIPRCPQRPGDNSKKTK